MRPTATGYTGQRRDSPGSPKLRQMDDLGLDSWGRGFGNFLPFAAAEDTGMQDESASAIANSWAAASAEAGANAGGASIP